MIICLVFYAGKDGLAAMLGESVEENNRPSDCPVKRVNKECTTLFRLAWDAAHMAGKKVRSKLIKNNNLIRINGAKNVQRTYFTRPLSQRFAQRANPGLNFPCEWH
jgi:hypothetical protein